MRDCHNPRSYRKSLGGFVMILAIVFLSGCSRSNEETGEKGRIETAADNTAKTIVKKIKTPISKARDTQDLGEERLQEMGKVMKQY